MKAVADRYDAGGELPRFVDRKGHGLDAGQLAERMAGVENDRALAFRNDRSCFIAGYRAFLQPFDIHIDQHHAMRRQPFEIGLNQSAGDCCGGGSWNANGGKQARNKLAEFRGRNGLSFRLEPCALI